MERTLRSTCREHEVDAHVATGVCNSITEAVIERASRRQPDLLIIPNEADNSVVDQPFRIRQQQIWSKVEAPVWAACTRIPRGNSIVGVVNCGSDSDRVASERVARATARLANHFGSEGFLLECIKPPTALEMAREALSSQQVGAAQREENAHLKRLYTLASRYRISDFNVRLHHGSEREVLEQLIPALGASVVVASGVPRRRFGGLVKQLPEADLIGLPSDLLIVGDCDAALV